MRTLLTTLTIGLAAATTAGCGSDDTDAPPTVARASTTAAALRAHVAGPADLPGLRVVSAPRDETLAQFAKTHDKTVAELRAAGYRAAAESAFQTLKGRSNGFSIAIRMRDGAAATREAKRLFTANSASEPGQRVTPLPVPGVAGARAVTLSGTDDGVRFTGAEVIWTTGPVLHELFLIGLAGQVDPAAVARSARSVDARVTG